MISLKHVSKSFDGGQHFAVDDVSFDVAREFLESQGLLAKEK
jgi:ABC-type Na+ transport system ATPase subunit NatA